MKKIFLSLIVLFMFVANPAQAKQADSKHVYSPDNVGFPVGNGQGKANHGAGTVGKADNKYPSGQTPGGSDHNNGYECDKNHGIGRTNPAHSGCGSTTTIFPTTTTVIGSTTTIVTTPPTTVTTVEGNTSTTASQNTTTSVVTVTTGTPTTTVATEVNGKHYFPNLPSTGIPAGIASFGLAGIALGLILRWNCARLGVDHRRER